MHRLRHGDAAQQRTQRMNSSTASVTANLKSKELTMSDRMPVEIAIGGPVPAHLVTELIAVLEAESLGHISDEGIVESGEELMELARDNNNQPGPLRLLNHEVADDGCLGQLVFFLVEHGIGFDCWNGAKYDYDALFFQFRPGMPEPRVYLSAQDQ